MNRTFQSKTSWYQILYILIVAGLCFYMMWVQQAILATILAVLLIILIERIIHTEYVLTDDSQLIVSKGRFTKPKTILLADITDIEQRTTAKFGSFYVTSFVLLTLNKNQYIALTPTHAERFITALVKRKEHHIED